MKKKKERKGERICRIEIIERKPFSTYPCKFAWLRGGFSAGKYISIRCARSPKLFQILDFSLGRRGPPIKRLLFIARHFTRVKLCSNSRAREFTLRAAKDAEPSNKSRIIDPTERFLPFSSRASAHNSEEPIKEQSCVPSLSLFFFF